MKWIPIFWLVMTLLAFLFNLLGMMRLVPFIISMPILFVSIYFTIFSFTHRKSFKGLR